MSAPSIPTAEKTPDSGGTITDAIIQDGGILRVDGGDAIGVTFGDPGVGIVSSSGAVISSLVSGGEL